jgi:hypothetical protein
MKRPRPDKLPTEHRLRRLQTWLGALLARAGVHVLDKVAPSLVADWLKLQRKRATILLVVRAMKRFTVPPRSERIFHRRIVHRVTIRRMAGSAFRRALKARTLSGQLAAIQCALANAERWIAALLRRFAQLFSRLLRFLFALAQDAAPPAHAHVPCAADSS